MFTEIGKIRNQHQVVVGDFNRKYINWDTMSSTSQDDRKFIEAVRDSFLTQQIRKATRGRGTNEPSLIDLLFTSHDQNIDNIEHCAPLGKSDHSLIKFIYRYKAEKMPDKIVNDYAR